MLGGSLSLVGWGQGFGSQLSCPALGKAECGPGAVLTHPIPRLHRLPSLPSGLATRADGPPDTSQRPFFLSSRTATGNTAFLCLVSSHPHQTSHIHLLPQRVVSRPRGDAPAGKFCCGGWGRTPPSHGPKQNRRDHSASPHSEHLFKFFTVVY